MKKSTFSKVAIGSTCALLAIVMTGCASANQDAAIKNLSSQLDRVTNTVGQMSTADIQSLNPTDYYANTTRSFNNGLTMQNTENGRKYNQSTSYRTGEDYIKHGLANGVATTDNTPISNNYQPSNTYQTHNEISNNRQPYHGYSQTNGQNSDRTLNHVDTDNHVNRISKPIHTSYVNANQNETNGRNYYYYQYQNPAVPNTYQTGNANTSLTKNQRLSTAISKTMNCAYEQDFMKENLLNQCTMIKNDIHQKLKLSSNQVKALNGLTNSISRYATNLNNNKTDVTNSIKMIRKNSNKKDYSQLDQVNAYYQALNNHLDARLCYFQNLMNTMDEVQSLLDEAKFGANPNTQTQNNSLDTNTIRTTEKTTPSRNIYNGRQSYHYPDQQTEQSNVNNNPQSVQEGTKKNIKNIDTMTSSHNNTENNTTNTNNQNDTQYNNHQNGVYYDNAYGSNGPNGGYYNSNGINGNRNNQVFNPNRNTDTYGPGVTNIDTYKTNPAGTYNNGQYTGVNYGNDLQVQPEGVRNDINVNHAAHPTNPVTNVTQQNKPSTLQSDKKTIQEAPNAKMNNCAKDTENISSSTDNEKPVLPTKTMEQPRTVIRQNMKEKDDLKTIHGKIINGPSTQQPQVSDTQTRTQEVKKVHPAGVRPTSANHVLSIANDTNKTIERLIKG